ncbi:hypothetical protein LA080_011819 [Diaporthe eres]|nr:hypothetical protein LA080_011819 [Diaporthe eres]
MRQTGPRGDGAHANPVMENWPVALVTWRKHIGAAKPKLEYDEFAYAGRAHESSDWALGMHAGVAQLVTFKDAGLAPMPPSRQAVLEKPEAT